MCGATEAERFSVRASVRTFFVYGKMICCGFGHRNIYENISKQVGSAVAYAIEKGCTIFYTGSMGDFDRLFSSAVRKAKTIYPNVKLICIKPYFTNELNVNKAYYDTRFDDVVIPNEIIGIHYKSAIKARNRWMVDMSDIVLGYTIRNSGGAYTALRYAEKYGREIIEISRMK